MKLQVTVILILFFGIDFSTIPAQSKNGTDDISVSRNVSATRYSPDGEPEVVITLIINKNTTRGHATLEEDFSTDLEATAVKTGNATFETKNGKATFEWATIPADKVITVSYQLVPISKAKEDQAVFGQFTYLNHINTISPSSFSLKIVTGEKKPIPIPKKIPAPVKTSSVNSNNSNPAPVKTSPVNSNPIPVKTGLIYRIQIAAVGDKPQAEDILKKYNITDEPYLEPVNASATRLMIGSYSNLSLAKARITDLKGKGLNEAFVVPYYNGKRITLQEAAMHTKQ